MGALLIRNDWSTFDSSRLYVVVHELEVLHIVHYINSHLGLLIVTMALTDQWWNREIESPGPRTCNILTLKERSQVK